jgi:hypothetical protein
MRWGRRMNWQDISTAPKDGTRTPVTTIEELDSLDLDEICEGYREGFAGEPEPGNNRSKSFWHGWRNGYHDRNGISDPASTALARAHVARFRSAPHGDA